MIGPMPCFVTLLLIVSCGCALDRSPGQPGGPSGHPGDFVMAGAGALEDPSLLSTGPTLAQSERDGDVEDAEVPPGADDIPPGPPDAEPLPPLPEPEPAQAEPEPPVNPPSTEPAMVPALGECPPLYECEEAGGGIDYCVDGGNLVFEPLTTGPCDGTCGKYEKAGKVWDQLCVRPTAEYPIGERHCVVLCYQ